MKPSPCWTLLAVVVVLITLGLAGPANASQEAEYVPGQVLVRFYSSRPEPAQKQIIGPMSDFAVKNIVSQEILPSSKVSKDLSRALQGLCVVELPPGVSVSEAILEYNKSDEVFYAQPNYLYRLMFEPDDPLFAEQWNMENTGQTGGTPGADIEAVPAWSIIDEQGIWDPFDTENSTIVAVTDTGIDYNHPDLSENIWVNPDEEADDIHGIDTADDDDDPMDVDGHGTHVAGIIGASGNNALGVAGTAWRSRLMAVKIFPDEEDGAPVSAIIEGINYSIENGARVINASWGGYGFSNPIFEVILDARNEGILFVAAAGNDNINNDILPVYPASYGLDNIISVMSTDHNDQKSDFSNYGATSVHIAAPGTNIWSTYLADEDAEEEQDPYAYSYASGSGTSMAAPHVAGAAAIVWDLQPELTYLEVRDILLASVDVLPSLEGLCQTEGRLNLNIAAQIAAGAGQVLNVNTDVIYTGISAIQDAIDEAEDGHELIAEMDAIYISPVDFGDKSITLRSGNIEDLNDQNVYPEDTLLWPILGRADGPITAVTISGDNADEAELKGFTILDSGNSGVRVTNGADAVIEDCIITENRTEGSGAGIYFAGESLVVSGCEISYNESQSSGGGIYFDGGYLDLTDTIINDNIAVIEVEDHNWWDYAGGGGIYLGSASGDVIIERCQILNNIASIPNNYIYAGGGGIFSLVDADIDQCEISGNSTTTRGGGVYFELADPNISNSIIHANEARWYGGGIYVYGATDEARFNNILFTANRAINYDGGGIYLEYCDQPQISNCTFANNEAHQSDGLGAAVFAFDSDPQIGDSIMSGNTPNAVAVDDDHFADLFYNLFYENSDADYVIYDREKYDWDGLVDVLLIYTAEQLGDGNKTGNPMFVEGMHGDYYLSNYNAGQRLDPNGLIVGIHEGTDLEDANSPAINAGSRTAAEAGMDQYTTRTDHSLDTGSVDIGFHYVETPEVGDLDLDITHDGPGRGETDPDEGMHEFIQFSHVIIRAEADENFGFGSWEGTDDDEAVELDNQGLPVREQFNIVTMNDDRSVVVTFVRAQITLILDIEPDDEGNTNGRVSPSRPITRPRGSVVTMEADPDNPSDVIVWDGSDDDSSSLSRNQVTLREDPTVVTVRFYAPQVWRVPDDYAASDLQTAIDAANPHDKIVLAESDEPHVISSGVVIDKPLTISGENPDDPDTSMRTVIEPEFGPDGGIFTAFSFSGVDQRTVIEGITIRDFWFSVPSGDGGEDPGDPGQPGVTYGGGAMRMLSSSPIIRNVIIEDCGISAGSGGPGAGGDGDNPDGGDGGEPGNATGGAVYITGDSNPLFVNVTFRDNQAIGGDGGDGGDADGDGGSGGRAGGWSYDVPWAEVPSGRGGAVYIGLGSAAEFRDCIFEDNYSFGGLSGISGLNQPVGLRSEPSLRYRIPNHGGAVYVDSGASGLFKNTSFQNNMADPNTAPTSRTSIVGYGGAVAYAENADIEFIDCIITGNTASMGGGLYGNYADSLIVGTQFTSNTSERAGGASITGGRARIAECLFLNNSADMSQGGIAGGLALLGANSMLFDTEFVNNNTGGSGGGLYVSSRDVHGAPVEGWDDTVDSVLVKNCLFDGNIADISGGGIAAHWHSDPEIVNCTIVNNLVADGYGGGISAALGNYTQVRNSVLWGNSTLRGRQIAIRTEGNPSTVDVSYSMVEGGSLVYGSEVGGDIWADNNCELIWPEPGEDGENIIGLEDPLFVEGPLGDYYLSRSQLPEQEEDSPLIQQGHGDASQLPFGPYPYTTWTQWIDPETQIPNHEYDPNEPIDVGYHYPKPGEFALGDINYDGVIDDKDLNLLVKWIPSENCTFPDWCQGRDLNRDGRVDMLDYAILVSKFGQGDTMPPSPNPSTWSTPPTSAGASAIGMRATRSYDNSGRDVYYYFQCIMGQDSGCTDSGWQLEREYTDTGLQSDVIYGYRVRTADFSGPNAVDPENLDAYDRFNPNDPNVGNKTDWSQVAYSQTGEDEFVDDDETPPTNLVWIVPPGWDDELGGIYMEAHAEHPTQIQYEFENMDTGRIRTWSPDPTWLDTTGLEDGEEYSYRFRAIDAFDNESEWSDIETAIVGEVVDPDPPVTNVWPDDPYRPHFEYPGPEWELNADDYFIHEMTAVEATDENEPVEYRFRCWENGQRRSGYDRGWSPDPTHSVMVSQVGFGNKAHWRWQVQTRDSEGNESPWSYYYSAHEGPSYIFGSAHGGPIIWDPANEDEIPWPAAGGD